MSKWNYPTDIKSKSNKKKTYTEADRAKDRQARKDLRKKIKAEQHAERMKKA